MMDSFQKTMSRMRETVLTGSIPNSRKYKSKKKRSYGRLLILLAIVGAIGGGGYYAANSDVVSDTFSKYGGTSAQFKLVGDQSQVQHSDSMRREKPSFGADQNIKKSAKLKTKSAHKAKVKKTAKKAKKSSAKLSHKQGKAKKKKART